MKRIAVLGVTSIWCAGVAAGCAALAGSAGPVVWGGTRVVDTVAAQADSPTLGGLPLVDVWGGAARVVAGEGAIGFVAGWRYIETIDLAADPPRVLGRHLLDDPVSAIAARAGRLYVASHGTLIVFDVIQPVRPREIGRIELPAAPGATLRPRIVRIAPGEGAIWLNVVPHEIELPVHRLVAVDEANPAELTRIADVAIDRPRGVAGMWRFEDRLIVATGTRGNGIPFVTHVSALDVGDPAAPRWVGEAEPFNGYGGAALRGQHLFVAVGRSPQLPELSPDPTTGIRVLDVAAAEGPTLVGRLDAQDEYFGLDIVGATAFVGVFEPRGGCAVAVIDVRTTQPAERLRRPCSEMPPVGSPTHAHGNRWLSTVGDIPGFYGRTEHPRWEAWSATADAPQLLGRGDAAHAAVAVAADAGRLLVFDGSAVRLVEPVGMTWNVRLVAAEMAREFPEANDQFRVVALSGDRAIVAGYVGVVVFDVAAAVARRVGDLHWTAISASLPSQEISGVLIGDKAVLDLHQPGSTFIVLDLADPAHPTRITTPWDGLDVTGLAVDGERLYAVTGNQLYIFVRGGPYGFRLVGEWNADAAGENNVLCVTARGDRAVIGGYAVLQVLDVRDPAAVRLVAERRDADFHNVAFVGPDIVGIRSRSDPGSETGLQYLHGEAATDIAWQPGVSFDVDLAVIGDRLFVPSRGGGLMVFRPWRLPDGWRAAYRLALPWLSP